VAVLALALVAVLIFALVTRFGSRPQSVDPSQELREAAAAMSRLKTVSATLKFTKGAITFQGFTLVGAKTSVRLPGDSDTIYTVKQQDFTISLEVVISGGHVYLHIPFSTFQELTGNEAAAIPDLAKLFDPSSGLPAVIPSGRNLKSAGADEIGDVDVQKIEATYSGAQVSGMLPQLASNVDVNAELWVGASDHLIRKAVLDGAFGDGGNQSSVEVDISGFNAAVNITPPTP
jgi:hypothetical protein